MVDLKAGLSGDCEIPDDLDRYPEGQYVVVTGGVLGGFKFYGPWCKIRDAVEWAEKRILILGRVTVVDVVRPEKSGIGPIDL